MKRSKFSLSHYHILTGDMGEMIPIGLQEVLPGDSFQHDTKLLLRVSPLLAPVMHPVRVKIEHYFVPHRIVWEDSEDFFTGGDDGLSAPTFPTMAFTGAGQAAVGSLADYLGVPTAVDATVSALPFRGYAKIYNEHKRNTLVQTPLVVSEASGADVTTSRVLKNANWQQDYFTSASPEPQLGPEVTIPLATSAPVTGTFSGPVGNALGSMYAGNLVTPAIADDSVGAGLPDMRMDSVGSAGVDNNVFPVVLDDSLPFDVEQGGTGLIADLSAATGVTIRQLRESSALQRFFEAQMLHGSRYSELLSQWGVKYSDARLQRPEYLGGGKHTIQFSEVLQTGVTDDGDPDGVGNLKGHGIATARSNKYRRTFEEHGYVFTLLTVLPETMYVQGLQRTWNRRSKTDFYIPQLAHIGQQEILNKEIYAGHATPDGVFAYQDRYDEYRRAVSSVHGEFRSTLDFWHYARIFGADPAYNSTFVTSNPTKRVNQVTSADVLWVFAQHSIQARRIVDSNSTPSLI